MLGVTLLWTSIHPGGVEVLLVVSCHRNRDKLWPDGPLVLNVPFSTTLLCITDYFKTQLNFGANIIPADSFPT